MYFFQQCKLTDCVDIAGRSSAGASNKGGMEKISYFRDFADLDHNLYCIKGALALVVLVSFSGYVC